MYRSFVDVESSGGKLKDLDGRRRLRMMVEDERCSVKEVVCGCDDMEVVGGILVRVLMFRKSGGWSFLLENLGNGLR